MDVKWTATIPQRKSWVFEIEQETAREYPANRDVFQYRLTAYNSEGNEDFDYVYDTFEGAQTGAELKWDVPFEAWAKAAE